MRSEKLVLFSIYDFNNLKFIFIFLIIILFPVFAIAAESSPIESPVESPVENPVNDNKQFIIKSIEVQGSRTMPSDTILGILQTRTGEEVVLKRIREDVKELFKLGQFSDIQVETTGSEDGIRLNFILEEWPKVKDIKFEGNKEINDSKIKDALTIASGQSLSGKLLHENENKILTLYQKRGYYLAQVSSEIKNNDESSASLTFKINEGNKIEVKQIDIIGNKMVSDREIRKQMKIKKGKRFDDAYFEGDLKIIVEYYRQNGFTNARIINSTKEFNADRTGLILRIELEEGPQYRVGKLQAIIQPYESEDPVYTEKDILKNFTLEEGDVFSQIIFDEGIANINKIYFDKGRVFVRVDADRNYDPAQEIVDLTLRISEGGLAYIDSVPINWVSETSDEPHKTKEYIIRRELERFDIKKGELFSSQNIEDARRKILTLGPFIRMAQPQPRLAVEQNSGGGGQKVIVNFNVEESRQSGMFSIAGGYGSGDTGGGLFGAIDIWDDNIFGRAWRMQLRGELGQQERRTGQIYFSIPWIFNNPISLGVSLYSKSRITKYYYEDVDEETADRRYRSVGGSVTVGRPITRKVDLSIGLRNEKINYEQRVLSSPDSDPVWEKIPKSSGTTRSIRLILDRDTRQFMTSMFDPNRGTYNSFSSEYSGLLGGYEFQKYETESSIFIPTWWKLVLVFHMQTGYLSGKDAKILEYERFALGGMDSVRGYPRWSIMPSGGRKSSIWSGIKTQDTTDYSSRPFGGNKMALLNVEYRFPITDMLRGLIFFDAGQAWDDNEWPWDKFKPRKSIGVGLRIDLLGALARLEYGYALDEAREGEGVKRVGFQFDIGPAF